MPSQHGVSIPVSIRDGPLENLWGGRAKYTKKKSRKGKLKEKNSCTPINPKKYSCYDLKKFIQGIWERKKILAARKFPSLPHNFSNGPSLNLGKTFLRISRIQNILLAWILAKVFVYLPPFIFQIPDFLYFFILIYFEWRDTENQQLAWSKSFLQWRQERNRVTVITSS